MLQATYVPAQFGARSTDFPSLRNIGVFVWAGVLEGVHLPTAPSFTMALVPQALLVRSC